MKSKIEIIVIAAVTVLMLVLVFTLPSFSFSGYSILRNTICELGAQYSPNAWIMNSTIVLFAAGSVIAGWKFFEGIALHRILLVIFATSLALAAFFNHAPAGTDTFYDHAEAGLHSYFSLTAVLSFSIMSIATGFIMERQRERLLAVAAGLSVLALSILSSESDDLAGIWQRLMFIIVSGWMIYNFNSNNK